MKGPSLKYITDYLSLVKNQIVFLKFVFKTEFLLVYLILINAKHVTMRCKR